MDEPTLTAAQCGWEAGEKASSTAPAACPQTRATEKGREATEEHRAVGISDSLVHLGDLDCTVPGKKQVTGYSTSLESSPQQCLWERHQQNSRLVKGLRFSQHESESPVTLWKSAFDDEQGGARVPWENGGSLSPGGKRRPSPACGRALS